MEVPRSPRARSEHVGAELLEYGPVEAQLRAQLIHRRLGCALAKDCPHRVTGDQVDEHEDHDDEAQDDGHHLEEAPAT